MDKYEYQVCADQIKSFVKENRFAEAMEIADKIDWRRVKSNEMLGIVSDVYKVNKRYEDSWDLLQLAYDRRPTRENVYSLCELAIKMGDVVSAVEYYKQYMRIAPDDTNSYILLYKIYEAQDVTLEERIQVLEEFKKRDYREKWAYELARLYHKTGQKTKCIEECDEMILWFGEGPYVRKAMELKMEYTDLTPEQKRKYEGRPSPQVVESYGQPIQGPYDPYASGQKDAANYSAGDLYGQTPYGQGAYGEGIEVQPVNTGKYSTMNLQEELARSMEAFMSQDGQDIQGQYYGPTEALYEPAQDPNAYANPYGSDYEQSFSQQTDISRQMYEQGVYEPVVTADTGRIDQTEPEEPQESVSEKNNPPESSTDKQFENNLKQEYDGQIALSLPDTEMVERQITGQINLDDILNGFEDRKREADEKKEEERRLEEQRRRAEQNKDVSQTDDLMSQLAGVIPGTTTGVLPSGRILTLEEEYGGNLTKLREEDARAMEEAAKTPPEPAPVPEPMKPEEAVAPVPQAEERPQEAPAPQPEEVLQEVPVPQPEEVPQEAPVPLTEGAAPAEPETPPAEAEPEVPAEAVAEAAEEAPLPQPEEVLQPAGEQIQEQPPIDPMAAYQGMDFGEVEEIEDIEQPDDIDDMLKTSNMPIGDIDRIAQANYEAGIETEDTDTRRGYHPSYMTLEEAVHSRRDFNEEEAKIFVRFEGIEALKAQIVDAMDTLSMEAYHGNVIVTGPDNSGRKSLAIDIVKAIQSRDQNFSGKVAKISGEALNKKNIPLTIKKLKNGALIVENAGGLTLESVNIITDALRQETEPVLVVLEGATDSMVPILRASRFMPEVFNARIEISPYTNDNLVAYGRGYAREQEYSIDDMGMLALYTRIGEMQSLDHQVSIEEVQEIVDAAIRHVDRKNMAHFMDVLLAKRYDDDDYIVLREKDFIQ